LSLTATWVFPFAILFNLPYEAYHEQKIKSRVVAICSWLGSAPTALTATLWNVWQIRWCHRRAAADEDARRDEYYVLSCLN